MFRSIQKVSIVSQAVVRSTSLTTQWPHHRPQPQNIFANFLHSNFSRFAVGNLHLKNAPPPSLFPPLILDGSINLELDPSCDITTTATPRAALDALLFSPHRVREVHKRYLDAGANITTTANFSVSPYFLSRFDDNANWHRPGAPWAYGDNMPFHSHWPSDPIPVPSVCPTPQPSARTPSSSTASSPASLEHITLAYLAAQDSIPPTVPHVLTTPRHASSPNPLLAICIPPENDSAVYRAPRLDCMSVTPLTRLFELTSLCGKLAREAVDSARDEGVPQSLSLANTDTSTDTSTHTDTSADTGSAAASACDDEWEAILSACRSRKLVAGCMAPLFGPGDVLLRREYDHFRSTGHPTPLLETLWALSEYADGYSLRAGVVINAYDLDPTLQPPRRALSVCSPDLPPVKSATALAASIYRGVAMALYPYTDAYLCESLADIRTAEAVSSAAMATDKPVFVSFQLSNDDYGVPRLLSCETLAQAIDRLLHVLPRFVSGYSVNCSSAAIITAALPLLRTITRKPIGAYAKLPYSVCAESSPLVRFEHDQIATASPLIRRAHTLEELDVTSRISGDAMGVVKGGPCGDDTATGTADGWASADATSSDAGIGVATDGYVRASVHASKAAVKAAGAANGDGTAQDEAAVVVGASEYVADRITLAEMPSSGPALSAQSGKQGVGVGVTREEMMDSDPSDDEATSVYDVEIEVREHKALRRAREGTATATEQPNADGAGAGAGIGVGVFPPGISASTVTLADLISGIATEAAHTATRAGVNADAETALHRPAAREEGSNMSRMSMSTPCPDGCDMHLYEDGASHSYPVSAPSSAPASASRMALQTHMQTHRHSHPRAPAEAEAASAAGPPQSAERAEEEEDMASHRDYTTTLVSVSNSLLSNKDKRHVAAKLVQKVVVADSTQLPEAYAALASFWATDLGADVIGGCCGVSVTHVKVMADMVNQEYERRLKHWYETQKK